MQSMQAVVRPVDCAVSRLEREFSLFGVPIEAGDIVMLPENLSKAEVLDRLIERVYARDNVVDQDAFRRAVFERESIMSTGIGGGVAIPHVRMREVRNTQLVIGVAPSGIDFESLDSERVYVIVLFAIPHDAHREYLGILAQVMLTLKTPGIRQRLAMCSTVEKVLDTLHP